MKERERHRLFVEHFMGAAAGNATQAVLMAGITRNRRSAAVIGARLLANVSIHAMIEARRAADPKVMTREELQLLWSEMARDQKRPDSIRLQASITLGKTLGVFVEQVAAREDVRYVFSWEGDDDEPKPAESPAAPDTWAVD